MAVLPDGMLYPCRRLEIPIGSLASERLTDLWKDSPVLQSLRDKAHIKGKCGGCAIEGCIGCRAMTHALTGDYLGADPHCWIDDSEETPSVQ